MTQFTREDLKKVKPKIADGQQYIKVGMSTCGIAAGAQDVFDLLTKEIKQHDLNVIVSRTGCLGMCHAEPLIEVAIDGLPSVIYGRVNKEIAHRIMEEHVCGKRLVNDHIFDLPVRR
ncbi:MAG TPA: (2Fe-2S) ferredoxin domain-containing protein [Chitinispirillaceae bacterium]|nr:(2Fe-2S) ferredoxin domain-containing protein [Chitinispirillaceae bacterium]